MKIYGNLLALCVFYANAWGTTTAFAPKAPSSGEAARSSLDAVSRGGPRSLPDSPTSFPQAPGSLDGRMTRRPDVRSSRGGPTRDILEIWNSMAPTKVQGNSLRTWSFASPMVERVQVLAKTEGRPLNADIELWQGPDNSPQKMAVYVEDGRPFSAIIETPRGSNAIAVRNTGPLEFPFNAAVEDDSGPGGLGAVTRDLFERGEPRIVQGGAVHTYPFSPSVESVQIMLTTDGRPLNARVELLQGPNNIKQVVELYTEDGMDRPFSAVIETPGTGNVIRIVNTATVEFPLTARVEPYLVLSGARDGESLMGPVTGGSGGGGFGERRPLW